MSVRQVWKRKTPPPKSSPTCHNDSPPPPPRNTPHSISPPMNYPQRDQIINQLHTISTLIDSQIPTPPSSPLSLVQPPTHAQVGCHASFCHCCRLERENVELQEQATLAKIKEWDNVQAMIDADYELCKRLQEHEQETDEHEEAEEDDEAEMKKHMEIDS
ncbi:hypothetical protein Tco_0678877 [Tanacetum coccineum]|uniref:Uncharacterized protein n=1 Tax=Tanacetum coccineum TaxID=301880 RepID=A0ABQ4XHA1_9ASTR